MLLIESKLPKDLIYKVGCYAQICAHIEHALWLYYIDEQQVRENDTDQADHLMSLRLEISSLLKKLERHAKKTKGKLPSAEINLLARIVGEVREGLPIRNRIIHGALISDLNGDIRLLGHWRERPRRNLYRMLKEPVTNEEIDEPLRVANAIHNRVLELLQMAADRRAKTVDDK